MPSPAAWASRIWRCATMIRWTAGTPWHGRPGGKPGTCIARPALAHVDSRRGDQHRPRRTHAPADLWRQWAKRTSGGVSGRRIRGAPDARRAHSGSAGGSRPDRNAQDACASGHSQRGPCHFARALVESGQARDVHQAFDRYLSEGRPGYVPRASLPTGDTVAALSGMGLVVVLAHPMRLELERETLYALIREWKARGLQGCGGVSSLCRTARSALLDALAREKGCW